MVEWLSINPWVQTKLKPEIVVCGAGEDCVSKLDPKHGFSRQSKSARTIFARPTAPATLSWPAPCSKVLKPASGWAVYISSTFTMFGVRLEFVSNSSAAAPATIGADIDVPLRYMSFMLEVEYLFV